MRIAGIPTIFGQIGLGRLADEGFERIGNRICPPGTAIPDGLCDSAAEELGLKPGTAVAVGLIDAHAGALGTLGAEGLDGTLEQRLAYVFGTSACTLNVGEEPAFVPGVWGPYHSALVPGLWLNEGGQSAAGAAIDHLVRQHGLAAETEKKAKAEGMGLTAWLEQRATTLLRQRSFGEIVGGLHVVAEFLGNRAPFADPDARAVIAGLDMAQDENSLVRLYLAGVASIGYGLRQIAETLRDKGADLKQVVISGGAGRSPLVRQILADATGLSIATCASPEPVLLGSAMTAAVAAGHQPDLRTAMSALSRMDEATTPDRQQAPLHVRRYDAFTALQDMERRLRQDTF